MRKYILFTLSLFTLFACSKSKETDKAEDFQKQPNNLNSKMELNKVSFGKAEGKEVFLFTLKNKNGIEVRITNYGGIVTHLFAPDKNGNYADIVLGFDSLKGYLAENPYFGALVGRYANRIANGEFTIDGQLYHLAKNNGPNALHGGIKGFNKVIWTPEEIKRPNAIGVRLTYLSRDMEEGYPGNLTATVTYTLNNDNELEIKYSASTDKKTHVNLTNHSYFNLSAGSAPNILDHQLIIYANRYTPVNKDLIPTGALEQVKDSPMDFTTSHKIGERIHQVEGGYDHNYILNDSTSEVSLAAKVYEPLTGRVLEVLTNQPGIQFYSGNFLDGSITGKNNTKYVKHYGFCLETQHFPDSPNQPNFPSTLLAPGEKYNYTTIYRFSSRK